MNLHVYTLYMDKSTKNSENVSVENLFFKHGRKGKKEFVK